MRVCNSCKLEKPLREYYSSMKKRNDGTQYIYHRPDCKDCVVKKSYSWRAKNEDAFKESKKKSYRNNRDPYLARSNLRRMKGKHKEWQRKNPDKVRKYRLKREMHKTHEISDAEWENCKQYFNYTCAYCGVSEDTHRKTFNQQLHKEHVNHIGSNKIDNCIPACKSCNGSKSTSEMIGWYTRREDIFSSERLAKINQWLNKDYKLSKSN